VVVVICIGFTVAAASTESVAAMRLGTLTVVAGALLVSARTRRREAAERDQAVRELAEARRALEERKVVERAKGLLMTALGVPEPDAFRRLQLAARRRNLHLIDVARAIVEQEAILAAGADAKSARS
jgi:response regulator NasT